MIMFASGAQAATPTRMASGVTWSRKRCAYLGARLLSGLFSANVLYICPICH